MWVFRNMISRNQLTLDAEAPSGAGQVLVGGQKRQVVAERRRQMQGRRSCSTITPIPSIPCCANATCLPTHCCTASLALMARLALRPTAWTGLPAQSPLRRRQGG